MLVDERLLGVKRAAFDVGIHLPFLAALADARLVDGSVEALFHFGLWLQILVMTTEIRDNHLQAAIVEFDVRLVINEGGE